MRNSAKRLKALWSVLEIASKDNIARVEIETVMEDVRMVTVSGRPQTIACAAIMMQDECFDGVIWGCNIYAGHDKTDKAHSHICIPLSMTDDLTRRVKHAGR